MTAVIRSAAAADAAAITSVFLASRAATMAYLPRLYDDEQTAAWITPSFFPIVRSGWHRAPRWSVS